MKLVKFNAKTIVKMIPDDKYEEYCKKNIDLRDNDFLQFKAKLEAPTVWEFKTFEVGEIGNVPNHYYDFYKNTEVTIPNSFDKYKDKSGQPIPYDMSEAERHGDVSGLHEFTKKVKLFELMDEKSIKERKFK